MNVQSRMKANTGPSQLSSPESAKPSPQFSQQSRPAPPSAPRQPYGHAAQPPNNSWRFTNSFESQTSPVVEQKKSSQPQSAGQAKPQVEMFVELLPGFALTEIWTPPRMFAFPFQPETSPVKPAVENSLRILTAVIRGMRHWSQFKDKVPYLFEIFGQLMFFFSLVSTD